MTKDIEQIQELKLPARYVTLTWEERRFVKEKYVKLQDGKCFWCQSNLQEEAPKNITDKIINWKLFPKNFLKYPIHLQHNHQNGLTEGAVHNYCNAVMWQYHKR